MSKQHPELESIFPIQKLNWIIALNIILIIGIIMFAFLYVLHTPPSQTKTQPDETQDIPVALSAPEKVQGMRTTPIHWEISVSVPKQAVYGSQ